MPRDWCQEKIRFAGHLALNERSMESGERFRYSRSSHYEWFPPRSYRSGKNGRGVCVPDCGIAAVDADVGVSVDVARNCVLHGKHVRGAWTRKDELA
jgi:hypothetical protein